MSATLAPWLVHKPDCDAAAWEQRKAVGQIPSYARPPCTCGLDAAIALEEAAWRTIERGWGELHAKVDQLAARVLEPCYCCVEDRGFRNGHPAFCQPGCGCWGRCTDPTCCEPDPDPRATTTGGGT